MPHFVNYNGQILHEDMPLVGAANRGLRYGDGVFETLKIVDLEIQLKPYHFDRLFSALNVLHFEIQSFFTPAFLEEQIRSICLKNHVARTARVRLNVFRKNGGLYDPVDHAPDFVIEASALPEIYLKLNYNGLVVDIFDGVRKACDSFSSIKSNNYLPYAMGALHAKQNQWNDCLILNTRERICDTTIANVFWVKEEAIFTPPLTEGCIDGVMRRHLLNALPQKGHPVEERNLEIDDLVKADEVFLTNAISGLRWVKEFRGKSYKNTVAQAIASWLF